MSGVLERMAQRARGTLPTVEPRSTPLFAPAATGFADKEISPTGIQEVFDEAETSRGAVDRSRPRGQRSLLEEDDPGRVRAGNFDASGIRESGRSTTANPGGDDNQHPEASKPGSRRSKSQETTNSQLESDEEIAPTKQQPRVKNNAGDIEVAESLQAQRSSPQASVKVVMNQPQQERPFASALIERAVHDAAVKEVASSHEIAAPARSGASASRQHRQQDQRVAARNDAAAATSTSPAEQRTEIHISIGSIELRAPRVESRPQSVPFRPRVTLSDFLGRKPETGA